MPARRYLYIAAPGPSGTPNRFPDCHYTRLNEPRGHTAAHARTEHNSSREQGLLSQQLGLHMSEHSIIKFHVCFKQVQKDSSVEEEVEEQASPLREDRQTLLLPPRW